MFCYIDSFSIAQQVVELTPGNAEAIFSGDIDSVCQFMAHQYNQKLYDRIVLKGALADSIADQVRNYAMVNYSNNNIEIEVLK